MHKYELAFRDRPNYFELNITIRNLRIEYIEESHRFNLAEEKTFLIFYKKWPPLFWRIPCKNEKSEKALPHWSRFNPYLNFQRLIWFSFELDLIFPFFFNETQFYRNRCVIVLKYCRRDRHRLFAFSKCYKQHQLWDLRHSHSPWAQIFREAKDWYLPHFTPFHT